MTNSRSKGIRGEREAAKLWRRWFPECRRSFGQARDGYEQPDLIGGIEKDFYVEVKRYKKITEKHASKFLDKAMSDWVTWQKENDPDDKTDLILMVRGDGGQWVVYLTEWAWRRIIDVRPSTTNYVAMIDWPEFAAALDEIYPIHTNKEA